MRQKTKKGVAKMERYEGGVEGLGTEIRKNLGALCKKPFENQLSVSWSKISLNQLDLKKTRSNQLNLILKDPNKKNIIIFFRFIIIFVES